jgi:hypothetical protein
VITSFSGSYSFLSNFSQTRITIEGKTYPTVEHFFQASKALDPVEHDLIRVQPTAGQAKRAGKKVRLRKDWEQVKDEIMLTALRAKFTQHPQLAEWLINTGDRDLVEGNSWHDNYWGICSCISCSYTTGKNKLGLLLQQVRKEIKLNRYEKGKNSG